MLGSNEDSDVGFDTMVTNADSYFSAVDNVIGMVSSTAGVEQNSKNTTETGNKNTQSDQVLQIPHAQWPGFNFLVTLASFEKVK